MDERPIAEPEVAPGPSSPPRPGWIAGGWAPAVIWALVTFVGLAVFAILLVVLLNATADAETRLSGGTLLRIGMGLFYIFNRVGQTVKVSGISGDASTTLGGLTTGSATIAFALLGGTALVLLLLSRGGRAVGRQVGGSSLWRGLNGAKVALPYAALCLLGSFVFRWTFKAPIGSNEVRLVLHPSYLAALGWPLFLGIAAGFAGGYRSGNDGTQAPAWERTVWNALRGGWTMMMMALGLAFAGLLVMAVVKPDDTSAYFHGAFDPGFVPGILAIILTALAVPNMASLLLFPSMGACVSVKASVFHVCALSWSHFPSSTGASRSAASTIAGGGVPEFPAPSTAYFLFVLAPLVAVLVGGALAARRSGARTKRDAVMAGALAGVGYGVVAAVLAQMTSLVGKASGNAGSLGAGVSATLGPELVTGALLAVAWGVIGGAIGPAFAGRSLPTVGADSVPAGPPPVNLGFGPPPFPVPAAPPPADPSDPPRPEPPPPSPHPERAPGDDA